MDFAAREQGCFARFCSAPCLCEQLGDELAVEVVGIDGCIWKAVPKESYMEV